MIAQFALRCNNCPALTSCPRFIADADCWFEVNDRRPDLSTADGILDLIKEKVQVDYIRYQRAMRTNSAMGRANVDKGATSLSNTITRDLQILAELSVRFGQIDERGRPPQEKSELHIHAENVNVLQITSEEVEKCKILDKELELLQQKRKLLPQTKP